VVSRKWRIEGGGRRSAAGYRRLLGFRFESFLQLIPQRDLFPPTRPKNPPPPAPGWLPMGGAPDRCRSKNRSTTPLQKTRQARSWRPAPVPASAGQATVPQARSRVFLILGGPLLARPRNSFFCPAPESERRRGRVPGPRCPSLGRRLSPAKQNRTQANGASKNLTGRRDTKRSARDRNRANKRRRFPLIPGRAAAPWPEENKTESTTRKSRQVDGSSSPGPPFFKNRSWRLRGMAGSCLQRCKSLHLSRFPFSGP